MSPKKSGTVRFHEEVRVKKIRAKGKNRSLYATALDDDEDDEDFNDDEDEADADVIDYSGEGSESSEDMPDQEEGLVDEDDDRDIIQSLEDDLFAEDEDDFQRGGTASDFRIVMSQSCVQIFQRMKREWQPSASRLLLSKRKMWVKRTGY